MFEGPEFKNPATTPEEKLPQRPFESPQAEVRTVEQIPSQSAARKAMNEVIESLKKRKFEVIDTYTEEGTFGAPYARVEKGRELVKQRFEKREDAENYAERMNRTHGNPDPNIQQFQIREVDSYLLN